MQYGIQLNDQNPPARWDNGIPGILLIYNIIISSATIKKAAAKSKASAATVRARTRGAWRPAAIWQASYDHRDDDAEHFQSTRSELTSITPISALYRRSAKLTLGESYLQSDAFDSFNRYRASCAASATIRRRRRNCAAARFEIACARSNAKSRPQGAHGRNGARRTAFRIQISTSPFPVRCTREEQNGQTREFDVNTAFVSFLTRPWHYALRWRQSPADWTPTSITGNIQPRRKLLVGVTNGWSLWRAIEQLNLSGRAPGSGK
ncbi:hypothetical protein KCP74_10600 [Salmonella enterica subsp. enterica]|nr:hypothetical protein KCP74_10600 [Salmonella enterica subsp. enterica]